MRKLRWATLVILFAVHLSHAQDISRVEVSAGYSHLHILKGFTIPMEGGSASLAVNLNEWFGIAGDFGVYHGSPGVSLTGETYTFGPRFSYRQTQRIVPFVQSLFGGSHFSTSSGGISGGGTEFTFTLGGGLDIGLGKSHTFALRPQTDYFGIRAFGSTTSAARLSFGIVYRIHKKERP